VLGRAIAQFSDFPRGWILPSGGIFHGDGFCYPGAGGIPRTSTFPTLRGRNGGARQGYRPILRFSTGMNFAIRGQGDPPVPPHSPHFVVKIGVQARLPPSFLVPIYCGAEAKKCSGETAYFFCLRMISSTNRGTCALRDPHPRGNAAGCRGYAPAPRRPKISQTTGHLRL
jgi:hypothetical protein